MSISKFDDIREVLMNHDIEIVSEIESELICGMCQKLVKEPFVTICGCTHCGPCISSSLKLGERQCPGTKSECKDCLLDRNTDIYFDPKTNIRIGKLIGKCPNKLCDVETSIVEMKQHIQRCENRKSFCPYFSIGCDDSKITLKSIDSHFSDNCLNHAYMMVEHVNNSRNYTDELLKKYEERLQSQRNQMEELRVDLNQNRDLFMGGQHGLRKSRENGWMDRGIWKHLNNLNGNIHFSKILLIFVFAISVAYVVHFQRVYEEQLAAHRLQLHHLINEFKKNEYGGYLWKIENFSKALFEAKNDKEILIESTDFYSHKYGYRLKLQMYPNGVDYHKNLHLSIRLVLIVGIYDDILKWPFGKGVKINFLNQVTGEDIESSFVHNNGYLYPSLRRATSDKNDSAADLRFDLRSLTMEPGFMKNDTVYVSCSLKR